MDNQTVAALQQENRQLREQVAALAFELENVRARYQWMEELLEQSNIPICLWQGDEYVCKFANSAFLTVLGKLDAFGKTLREVFEEREMPGGLLELLPILERAYTSGEVQLIQEALIRLPNPETGTEEDRWFNLIYNPVRNGQGKVVGVASFAVEVTAQAQARQELHRQAQILEQVRGSVIVTDMAGMIISWNRDSTRIFGYEPAEAIGQSITIIYPPEEHERLINEVIRPLQSQGEHETETLAWNKAGKCFPLQLSLSLLRDENGRPIGMIGYSVDISQRKQQEQDLEIFKMVVESVPDGIGIATFDTGQIIYANPAYAAMLNYDEQIIGTSWNDLSADSPERRAQMVQEAIQQGFWQGEISCMRKDGSTFPASMSGTILYNTGGQPFVITGVVRDLTEQKRAEAERLALQEQIIDAQREDLRELSTPLIPISDTVMIMPVIGSIDSGRASMVMETLLEGVAQHQAALVILDITGVRVVDTQVAQAFIQAAQAVRLLGAQVMLTGIQPQIAQTIVHLGVDLSGIITYGSLQTGIAAALRLVDVDGIGEKGRK